MMTTSNDSLTNYNSLSAKLNDFQKSLHMPVGESKAPSDPENTIHSIFYTSHQKSSWFYHFTETLDVSEVKGRDGPVVYTTNHIPHGLCHTDICQELPKIVMKDGYEAHWTHNVGSNIIETAKLQFNAINIQTFDSIYFDDHTQFMVPDSDRRTHNRKLGNIPMLQEWSKALPSYTTSYTIPFFYNTKETLYFRLFFCGIMDRLTHSIALRRDLADLLLIRKTDTKELVTVNQHLYIETIDGEEVCQANRTLKTPQMYGKYLYFQSIECDYNRCPSSPEDVTNVFYIDHVDAFTSAPFDPEKEEMTTIALDKINTEYPVHSVFWKAQNVSALKKKYYSNYSTNPADHAKGWSPIADSSLDDGSSQFFKNYPSYRTELVDCADQFVTTPCEPGYNAYFFGRKVTDPYIKPGVVFGSSKNNGNLTVTLGDTNPYIGINEEERPSKDKYVLHVRMVSTRQLTFKSFPQNDADRTSQSAVITLTGN